ncbi:MAG: hypothetical protein ABIP53_09895 [Candidatus Limnocylindrales bacterium]
MATEVVTSNAVTASLVRRDRPGIVDRFLDLVNRLPGPALVSWTVIAVALVVIAHVVVWLSANRPLGVVHHDIAVPALMIAWLGWLLHTLNRVGDRTFDEFRPALGDPASEDAYRRSLTSIPDRFALVAAIVAVVVVSVAYYVGINPIREPGPPEIERIATPLWGATAALLGIVVLHTVRQLIVVRRLSAMASNVDIFKPEPLNALARLTAVGAIGLILFVLAFILYTPDQPIAYIIQEAFLLAVAVASFVLPLSVLHERLVTEKGRLMSASQDRLKGVLDRIHQTLDSDDLAQAERLNLTLRSVLSEHEVIGKLHTWPWSAGTFRGFASALLLPIALIVVTQVIDRFL